MHSNLTDRLSTLGGYVGHVEINSDFELLVNSTTHKSETVAELCGVLIGYLKVRQNSSNKVLSVSVVCNSFVYLTRPTNDGYLLVQFSKDQKLTGVWPSLDSLFLEANASN
jgi:hypothetical protein